MKVKFDDRYEKGHKKNPFTWEEFQNIREKGYRYWNGKFTIVICKTCGRSFVRKIRRYMDNDNFKYECKRCEKDESIIDFIKNCKDSQKILSYIYD
jgi:hypothetical protein